MVDIKISGRKISVSDGMRDRVTEKIGEALRVFEVQPMTCDVVLRVDKNPSNPERKTCETTVFVRDNVVRVVASSTDMYGAIDEAAEKVTRGGSFFSRDLGDLSPAFAQRGKKAYFDHRNTSLGKD